MRKIVALLMALLLGLYTAPVRADVNQQLQEINQLWQGSAHALAEVNCSSCHQDQQTKLVTQPTIESCQSCHEFAVGTFGWGKHGVRINEGLSPLTPAMAHLPMKQSALDKEMTCNACHNVHSVNTLTAAVDACLTCHNDNHSRNYRNSEHAQVFAAKELVRPDAESVTCATCHLPRQVEGEAVLVNHNNTYTLLPRDRMVKEVCLNCHGMEYSYRSIFDNELVEANFDHPPTLDLQTLDMVHALEERRTSEATQ